MIEVEVKFKLTDKQEEFLLQDAIFISEENLIDIYYDSADYILATKDYRLRTRNDKFLLKVPMNEYESSTMQIKIPKKEIEDELKIKALLNLPEAENFIESVLLAGLTPKFTVIKSRKKYQKDGFILDFDFLNIDEKIIKTCEVEFMVQSEEQVEKAKEDILKFALKHGITSDNIIKENFIEIIKKNKNI